MPNFDYCKYLNKQKHKRSETCTSRVDDACTAAIRFATVNNVCAHATDVLDVVAVVIVIVAQRYLLLNRSERRVHIELARTRYRYTTTIVTITNERNDETNRPVMPLSSTLLLLARATAIAVYRGT